jgi:hypothetical protein
MSKCVTMYEENKPSTLINDTRWGGHFFRAILVRSAMPNNNKIRRYLLINIVVIIKSSNFQFLIPNRPFILYRWLSVGVWLPYEHWSVANTDTRSAPIFWVARFFLWRLVWTASALDHLLICCSAPNTEDVIISSAFQRCRVHIFRYCVAAELEDFDRDSRTDGLIYMAANLVHFRPLFLEFLRQSKTSL